jgi:hypothetical protein
VPLPAAAAPPDPLPPPAPPSAAPPLPLVVGLVPEPPEEVAELVDVGVLVLVVVGVLVGVLVVVVVLVLVLVLVEALVLVEVGEVLVDVEVVDVRHSCSASRDAVAAPCLRLAASAELTDRGRLAIALFSDVEALAAASH